MSEPTTHVLKTWPEPFDAISKRRKTWEVRQDDRGFKEGDVLRLQRFDPDKPDGHIFPVVWCRVTYVLPLDPFGPVGYVGMSIEVLAYGADRPSASTAQEPSA